MKPPKKTSRRKSVVGKVSSKSNPRRTSGYGESENEKAAFAGRGLNNPGKNVTPGEEEEFSEDELGAAVATVGVQTSGIGGALDGRSELRNIQFRNEDRTTEPVKRKLEDVNGGVDTGPTYGECISLFTSPHRIKKMKVEKDVQTVSDINSIAITSQQSPKNGMSPPLSIQTPLSPQPKSQEEVTGPDAELDGMGADCGYAPDDPQTPVAEGPVDPVIGRILHLRYHILGVLGHGNFSTTYLAEDLPPEPDPPDTSNHMNSGGGRTGTLVAIKRVKGPWLNPMGHSEYEILRSLFLHDPPRHIIKPHFAFFDEEYIFNIILESLDSARPVSLPEGCTCVPSHIKRCKSTLACPERQYLFQKLMVQLLSGIHELNRHGLIHSDLTPANILYLPESNRIKIIDLGNAIKVDDPPVEGEAEFEVQSAHYRAPEILLGAGPLERKIDVWGAGVIGLEWLLDSAGRREIENKINELLGEGIGVDLDVSSLPIMAVSTPSRRALVTRMATIFGNVGSYRQGMFWREEYDMFGRTSEGSEGSEEMDEWGLPVPQVNRGILSRFLLNTTLSPGLSGFMGKMLEVDVWQRKTAAEVLRDEWLVKGLLGEWASILLDNTVIDSRVEMARDVMCVVREGTVSSGEDVWVEEIDDSGIAESAPSPSPSPSVDGEEGEGDERRSIKGIVPPAEFIGEKHIPSADDIEREPIPPIVDMDGEPGSVGEFPISPIPHHNSTVIPTNSIIPGSTNYATSKLPELSIINQVSQTSEHLVPSTPKKKKCFDDILLDDELPFLSPTEFPFTYTRFCPSPSPPLPQLFLSPSPEPLPPPSPGLYGRTEGGGEGEGEGEGEVFSFRLTPENALAAGLEVTVRQDSSEEVILCREEAVKDAQQGRIQPKVNTVLAEGLTSPPTPSHPSITLNDIQELVPQAEKQISLNESGGRAIDQPDLNSMWHMDLAIGVQESDPNDEDDDEVCLL